MALVKIEDFRGTVVENDVKGSLNSIGIISYVNSMGYIFYLTGIQGTTPKGYIDDNPNSHKLEMQKKICICDADELSFIDSNGELDTKSDGYKQSIEALKDTDIKTGLLLGKADITNRNWLSVDDRKVYYHHNITVTVNRNNLSDDDYALKCIDIVSDMLFN